MKKSRCKKCVHRKVCPHKAYFTEKEADGIDKCTNFMREKTIEVINVPKDQNIDTEFLECLMSWLYYLPYKKYSVRQGGKEVALIKVDKSNRKVDINMTAPVEYIDIQFTVK